MFKGSQGVNFKTVKSKSEVHDLIEDELTSLGSVNVSERGVITIYANRYTSFAHNCEITGFIREKQGKYFLELEWEASPKWILIIFIAICSLGIGLLLLILPFMASNDMQKKCTTVMDNIRFEIN